GCPQKIPCTADCRVRPPQRASSWLVVCESRLITTMGVLMRLGQRENPCDVIAAGTVAVLDSKGNGLTKVIERHGDLRERHAGMVSQAWLAYRSIPLEQHDEDSVEIGRGTRRWHAPGDGPLPIPQGSKGTLRQGMTLRGEDRRGCPESVALPHQLLTALDAIVECGSDALTVEDV